MHLNYDLKKPIPPQQLFKILLQSDFKQLECIDQATHVRQQRQILLTLISQYQQQIHKRLMQIQKLNKLIQIRNKLVHELTRLRDQRISIDRNIAYQIQCNKVKPEDKVIHRQAIIEIEELRGRNVTLEARLRELSQYSIRMEKHNQILGKENMYVKNRGIGLATTGIATNIGVGYAMDVDLCACRQKITNIMRNQEILSQQMKGRIKQRQLESQRYARQKQQQILERNRRRLEQFQNRVRRGL